MIYLVKPMRLLIKVVLAQIVYLDTMTLAVLHFFVFMNCMDTFTQLYEAIISIIMITLTCYINVQ